MFPNLLRRLALTWPAVARPTDAGRLAVGGAVALVVAAAVFILRFAADCPVGDEWDLLREVLTRGFGPTWVAAHHNEHRYVLAKVLWFGSLRLTGFDFRAGSVVSLGLMTAAVGFTLAAIRRARGRWVAADLLVPALGLHWGHGFTWLMSYQIAFALVPFCAAGFAWAVVRSSPRWAAVFAGLMALNGGFGLAWGGPLLAWVGYAAWRQKSGVAAVVALAGVAYLGFVLTTTPPSTSPWEQPGVVGFLEGVAMYPATGFGPSGFRPWGVERVVATVLGLGLGLAAVVVVGRKLLTDPADRVRAAGLFALLVGFAGTAAAVALYRGTAQGHRFVTPTAAGLTAAWLVLRVYATIRPAWSAVLAVAAVGLVAVNARYAYRDGLLFKSNQKAFLADVDRGEPALVLAGKWGAQRYILDPNGLNIAMLRTFQIGRFAKVPADPAYTAVPVPAAAMLPAWDGVGTPPAVAVPDPPGPVLGLRVRVEQTHREPWQNAILAWTADGTRRRADAALPLDAGRQHALVFATPGRPTAVTLEAAAIMQGGVKIVAVEWLLPATAK